MAYIPESSELLTNVVNKIPGFSLQNRFFFMPGFPQMAQAMVIEALDKYYPQNVQKYNITFTAFCSEGALIDIMQELPFDDIEFSSLPIMDGAKRAVELYLASYSQNELSKWFEFFISKIKGKNIDWKHGGYFNS